MQVFFIINLRDIFVLKLDMKDLRYPNPSILGLYNPNPSSISEEETKLNEEVNRRLHLRLTRLNQLLEDKIQKIEDSKSVWGSIEKEVTTDIIKLIGFKESNFKTTFDEVNKEIKIHKKNKALDILVDLFERETRGHMPMSKLVSVVEYLLDM